MPDQRKCTAMKRIILVLILSVFYIAGFSQTNVQPASFAQPDDQVTFTDAKIYPNPCKSEKVTIEYPGKEIAEISISNIAGKEVYKNKFPFAENKKQVELSDIPNGIYLVKIKTNDDKQVVKKLIVSKE